MTYIEIIGPTGVGKSTIYTKLTSQDRYIGAGQQGTVNTKVINRYFEKSEINQKYKILVKILPYKLKKFLLNSLIQYRMGDLAWQEFEKDYPDIVHNISYARKKLNDSSDPYSFFPASTFVRVAKKYQMAHSCVGNKEELLMGQGFLFYTSLLSWKLGKLEQFPINYFYRFPLPEIVIHLDAPVQTCLRRRHERNGKFDLQSIPDVSQEITKQQRFHESCYETSKVVTKLGTEVIKIDNVGDVNSVVDKIENKLSALVNH